MNHDRGGLLHKSPILSARVSSIQKHRAHLERQQPLRRNKSNKPFTSSYSPHTSAPDDFIVHCIKHYFSFRRLTRKFSRKARSQHHQTRSSRNDHRRHTASPSLYANYPRPLDYANADLLRGYPPMFKHSFLLNQGRASERVPRLQTLATTAHFILLCTSTRLLTSARLHLSPLLASSSKPPRTVPLLVGNLLTLLVINHQINLRWRQLCQLESHKVFFHPLRTLVFKHRLKHLHEILTTEPLSEAAVLGKMMFYHKRFCEWTRSHRTISPQSSALSSPRSFSVARFANGDKVTHILHHPGRCYCRRDLEWLPVMSDY